MVCLSLESFPLEGCPRDGAALRKKLWELTNPSLCLMVGPRMSSLAGDPLVDDSLLFAPLDAKDRFLTYSYACILYIYIGCTNTHVFMSTDR